MRNEPGLVPRPDLVLRGASVLDGTGADAVNADIAITGDRISSVGRVPQRGRREVDVSGLTVSPGFIDMHSHADLALITAPERWSAISQGITTEVVGQDGLGYAPVESTAVHELQKRVAGWNGPSPDRGIDWTSVAEYRSRIDGASVNAAVLASHGTIRLGIVGVEAKRARPEQLRQMQSVVEQALHDGAAGLSFGLTYAPGMFADHDELVAMSTVVAAAGRFVAPHHRSYGRDALGSYGEWLAIAAESGVAVHLTHAHLSFAVNRGRAHELLDAIDEARGSGLDVTLDSYPYDAGSSYLHALLPGDLQGRDSESLIGLLMTSSVRDELQRQLELHGTDGSHGVPVDWDRVVVSASRNLDAVGRSIRDLATAAGRRAIDVYCDLVAGDELTTMCIVHEGDEENVRRIMAHPAHMGGTDGLLVGERPHPRAFGTFPRFIGRYSRDLGVVPLPEMIRKLTSSPARRLGLDDRGVVRRGFAADLVCFDPERIIDGASWSAPRTPTEGIEHVIVNGTVVLENGRHTTERPGRALRPGTEQED